MAEPAKQVLADYLKARVTADQNAPNEARPFINQRDVLHVHSSDWRAWLAEQGMEPSKAEAAKPLRDAGLSVRAFPLPGEGRSLGFYIGPAPSGPKSLPRRVAERASRPRKAFGRPTAEQAEVIGRGLQAFEFGRGRGRARDRARRAPRRARPGGVGARARAANRGALRGAFVLPRSAPAYGAARPRSDRGAARAGGTAQAGAKHARCAYSRRHGSGRDRRSHMLCAAKPPGAAPRRNRGPTSRV